MRADRLISTLLLLQQRGRMSSRAIADVLEVSPRTVMRDIEALGSAGVPVYSVRGPKGGYQLWEGFRAQLTGLTSEEVAALPLWGHTLAAEVFDLGPALDRAQRKISIGLPDGMRERVLSTDALFVHDPGSPDTPDRSTLELLATAARRRVVMEAQWDNRSLVLYPLGLVDKAGQWFLVADGEGRRNVIPANQLRSLRSTGRRFRRPADFDLHEFWKSWSSANGTRR